MLKISAEEIRVRVRLILDEFEQNESNYLTEADDTSIDTLIYDKIPEALRFVYGNADVSLLEPHVIDNVFTMLSNVSGLDNRVVAEYRFLDIPTNGNNRMLRICYCGSSSWKKRLTEFITPEDAEFAKLFNKYTTGTPDRPMAALMDNADGITGISDEVCKSLYLFTFDTENETPYVAYMVEPEYAGGGEDEYDIPNKLYDAVCYYVAMLVMMVLNDERASRAMEMAGSLMGFVPAKEG